MLLLQTLQIYIDDGPEFVSMSPPRIRRILSKQTGVVRSVIEKEKGGFVYIVIIYIRVLAGIGSLWEEKFPCVDPAT